MTEEALSQFGMGENSHFAQWAGLTGSPLPLPQPGLAGSDFCFRQKFFLKKRSNSIDVLGNVGCGGRSIPGRGSQKS